MDASIERLADRVQRNETDLALDVRWRIFEVGPVRLEVPVPTLERRPPTTGYRTEGR